MNQSYKQIRVFLKFRLIHQQLLINLDFGWFWIVYKTFATITGPIASIILKKIGCRATQIIGGTLMVLGVGLASFATEAWHVYLLFSVLAG